jgi:hypothetical protein
MLGDSTGHLGQIKNFPPGQTIRFGNVEYIADVCGKLVFSGWVSDQSEDLTDAFMPISDTVLYQDHGMNHT